MWYLVDDGNKLVNVERCRVMNLLESSELVWNNDLSQRILRTSLSFPAHWVALYSTSEAALNLLCASKQWLSCCCVESLPRNSPLLSASLAYLQCQEPKANRHSRIWICKVRLSYMKSGVPQFIASSTPRPWFRARANDPIHPRLLGSGWTWRFCARAVLTVPKSLS